MKVIRRYLSSEITASILLVFAALLMLFAFLDLIHELGELGKGNYRLLHIIAFVLLSLPGHVYELFPIAALIGTLFAIAQLVASSEYTVMRVSGVSVPRMAFTLVQVGLLFSVLTFVIGEFVAPPAEQFAQQLRAKAITGVIAQEFRSGLWVKDERNFDKFDKAFGAYFKGVQSIPGIDVDLPLEWLKRKLQRRAQSEPLYGQHIEQRFGHYSGPPEKIDLWIHAVSLGETRAAALLIQTLRDQAWKGRLLLTHGTATGREAGASLLREGDAQAWLPLDVAAAVDGRGDGRPGGPPARAGDRRLERRLQAEPRP